MPADPETGVEIGVHAVYPDDAYSAKRLGTYLGALEDAWGVCLSLGALRVSEEGWEPPDSWSEIDTRDADLYSWPAIGPDLLPVRLRGAPEPMDLAFDVHGGKGFAALVYGCHLLVEVMRSPERISSWLPRLVDRWRPDPRYGEAEGHIFVTMLLALVTELTSIAAPEQVGAIGAGGTPEEIVRSRLSVPSSE